MEVQEQDKQPINNCITFNGTIVKEPVKVANDYYAILIKGEKKEELPPIIIKSNDKDISFFSLNKKICGFGTVGKNNDEWIIWGFQFAEKND